MNKRSFWNYFLDAALLVGFIAEFFLELTGLEGHQWLGVGVAVFSIYHLVLHWDWVKAVTRRLFVQISAQSKAYYMLDAILLLGLALISLTGIVISTWLDLALPDYLIWLDLHILISIATLVTLVIKIGLHWKWIIKTTRRIFKLPAANPSPQPAQPAVVTIDVSRREFASLMGVVGVASFVAAFKGMDGLVSTQPASAENTSAAAAPTATALPAASSRSRSVASTPAAGSSSTTSCRIRCNRRCSYPGQCRKYVDANNNKKCDLGECV